VTHEPDIAAYAARKLLLKDGAVIADVRQQPTVAEVGVQPNYGSASS